MSAASIPQIPGYTVLVPIGRGAYGSVYLAEDSAGRRVALKVVTTQVELSGSMRLGVGKPVRVMGSWIP